MSSRWLVAALVLSLILTVFSLASIQGAGPASDGHTDGVVKDRATWWQGWQGDRDLNGLDDRLDKALAGPYAASTTVPIFLVYDHMPTDDEVASVERLVEVDYRDHYVETLTIYQAPLALVPELLELSGVTQIQQQNQMTPFMDVSARAVKARPSNEYRDQDVWDTLGYDGSGINVAVLDTGVDDDHEALQGKFEAGYDATAAFGEPGDGTNNPDDGDGHGTHVAGTVMGNPPNGEYMGVAPGARLIDVKVMTDAGVSNSGYTRNGFEWCIDHKDELDIRVLSMSFGSTSGNDDGKSAEAATVNRAVEAGLVAVIAVGNDGEHRIPSPASADLAITVAASDDVDTVKRNDDGIASYSNFGPRLDDGDDNLLDELKPEITAPGTDITSSCALAPASPLGCTQNDQYIEMDGTSMATPHISGVAALMLEAEPGMTPKQVEKAMLIAGERRGNATHSDISDEYNDHWGWGLADAYRSVQAAKGGIVEVSIESPEKESQVSGKVLIEGTATAGAGLERIELEVSGQVYEIEADESWSINWNTRRVDNGDWRFKVTAYSRNNLSASDTIDLTIENTAKAEEEGDEGFMDKLNEQFHKLGDRTTGNPDHGLFVLIGAVVLVSVLAIGGKLAMGRRNRWDDW